MKKILLFVSAAALVVASCSKEIEDASPVQVAGKSTINATYEDVLSGDITRTEAQRVDGKTFTTTWDGTDVLGVFRAEKGSDINSPFVYDAGDAEAQAKFKGDLEILAGGEYVGYYPWDKNTSIDENGNITLTIPEKQNYRYNAKDANGSFAANVAPAVAFGQATEENDKLDMSFYAVASYMYVPFTGDGFVKDIKLEISNTCLSGDIQVNIDDIKTGDFSKVAAPASTEPTTITVKCYNPVKLTPGETTTFWFVVPGNLDIKDATVKFYVNGDEIPARNENYTKKTTPGNFFGLAKDNKGTAFEWIEDTQDACILRTPEEFLKYAYLATYGAVDSDNNSLADNADVVEFYTNGTLKRAVFANDIDLDELGEISSDHEIVTKEMTPFEKAVFYDHYKLTKNTIATIGNYTIEFDIDGRGYTLSNLTVKGSGLFSDCYEMNSGKSSESEVKNLVLENVTVDATEQKTAYYLTNRHYPGKGGITLTDITVGEGCVLTGAENPALIGRAFVGGEVELANPIKENKMETAVFADDLNIMGDVTIADYEYNKVTIHENAPGAIVTVADKTKAEEFMAEVTNNATWYSVIDETTSYWTGTMADTRDNKDGISTAEELAKAVNNGTGTGTFVLTNNIEIGYDKDWNSIVNMKANPSIDGTAAVYTINHVTVGEKGLFGGAATVKNLRVRNVSINGAYVLANTGTAENVIGEVFNYSKANAKEGLLAGLFYEGTMADVEATTGCEVNTKNLATDAKFGALYAKVNAAMGHEYTVPANTIGAYNPFAVLNVVNDEEDHNHGLNMFVTFANFTSAEGMPQAKELVNWVGKYTNGTKVEFLYQGEEQSGHGNAAVYKSATESLNGLAEGKDASLNNNITSDETLMQNGGTLNGNGYTFTVEGNNFGLSTAGGTIEDLVIEGEKGVILQDMTDDVTIDGVVFNTSKTAFTTGNNCEGKTLTVTNSEIHGNASWMGSDWNGSTDTWEGLLKEATFKDCKFYNPEGGQGLVGAFTTSTFTNCDFENGYQIQLDPVVDDAVFTFTNCTIAGKPLTINDFKVFFNKGTKGDKLGTANAEILCEIMKCTVVIDGVSTPVEKPEEFKGKKYTY